MRELSWFDAPVKCNEIQVGSLEKALGITLPLDYRLFLFAVGAGGSPEETDFEIKEPRGAFNASIGTFLSISDDDYGIMPSLELLESRKIDDLIPIAESGGGDFICLDYRVENSVSIAYWHHGRQGMADEVVTLCNDFSKFLDLLTIP